MSSQKVSAEDFVVAWATSRTMDDMVKNSGMNKPAIVQRAKYLRKRGVNLPKFERRAQLDTLHVAQLNSLIRKHDIRRQS